MTVDDFLEKLDKLPNSMLITETHLSAWLLVSPSKIQKDRGKGVGPRFTRLNGSVRYEVGKVRSYLAENGHSSTSSYEVGFAVEADLSELGQERRIPFARIGDQVLDFFSTLDQDIDEIVWLNEAEARKLPA